MNGHRLVFATGVVVALAACATPSAISQSSASRPTQRVVAGRCPHPPPGRSPAGPPDAIAPGAPAWTTFCIYGERGRQRGRVIAKANYRGGPLDRALNSSVTKLPPNTFCASEARSPAVVVLRYQRMIRFAVLDTGGCPDVVMSSGTRRYLSEYGQVTVINFYVKTVDLARRPGAPQY